METPAFLVIPNRYLLKFRKMGAELWGNMSERGFSFLEVTHLFHVRFTHFWANYGISHDVLSDKSSGILSQLYIYIYIYSGMFSGFLFGSPGICSDILSNALEVEVKAVASPSFREWL